MTPLGGHACPDGPAARVPCCDRRNRLLGRTSHWCSLLLLLLLGLINLATSHAKEHSVGGIGDPLDFDVVVRAQHLRNLAFDRREASSSYGGPGHNSSGCSSCGGSAGVLELSVSEDRLVGMVKGVPVKPLAGDALVAVNGMAVWGTLSEAEEAARAAARAREAFKAVVPLMEQGSAGHGRVLGFVKVEVLDSGVMTFRPMQGLRSDDVRRQVAQMETAEAKEAEDREEQQRRKQEEEAERRRLEEEAEELERRRRVEQVQQSRAEAERQARLREDGLAFHYKARFDKPGALGLTFDVTRREGSVVMAVEASSPAADKRVQVGDVLVGVNERNVSGLSAQEAIQALSRSAWPRLLTFLVPDQANNKAASSRSAGQKDQAGQEAGGGVAGRLEVVSPEVLQGSYPVLLAPWSLPSTTTPPPPPPCNDTSSNGTCQVEEEEGRPLVVASDLTGCLPRAYEAMTTRGGGGLASFVGLSRRGECTFVDKARRVQQAGGVGLVMVNSADSLLAMPAGSLFTQDIHTPTASVSSRVGELLLLASGWPSPVTARLHLTNTSTTTAPASKQPPPAPPSPPPPPPAAKGGRRHPSAPAAPLSSSGRRGRDEMEQGGRLLVQGGGGYYADFDFLSALFGPRLPQPLTGRVVVPDPSYGCDARAFKTRIAGTIVAVERGGGCAFSDKALAAQAGGALACVIMNTNGEQPLMRLMAAPEEADKVKIPVFMVSDKARRALLRLLRGGANEAIARLSEEKDWGTTYDHDDEG